MRPFRFPVGRTSAAFLLALCLAASPGCRRRSAQPSEAYVEAQTRFGKLYATRGDEAFVDPELAAIEALLAQVPANSLDAKAASDLRARIEDGKQQAQARRRSLEDARARAQEPTAAPASRLGDSRPPSLPPPAAAEPEDAGTDGGTTGSPAVGTDARELAQGFSGCFTQGASITVQGRGERERWELKDSEACRQQYAALADQVLLLENNKVFAMAPRKSIVAIPTDAGTPPAPAPTPAPEPAADAGAP